MLSKLFNDWRAKVIGVIFIFFVLWWSFLQGVARSGSGYFDTFASTYCIFALWGGAWGIHVASKWGGLKSVMGRAILFFSLGLFAQAFGQISYSYYVVVKHIEVPYPSIGDLGYFGSIPLYIYAALLLAKASGISLNLRTLANKLVAIFLPLVILLISYFIFLKDYQFDWSAPLVIFLDFAYPMGQSIYISIALLTFYMSRRYLGGRLKIRILIILIALSIQYCADFIFLYQASKGEWLAAGINDFIYLLGYFVMSLGLLQFGSVLEELRLKTAVNQYA